MAQKSNLDDVTLNDIWDVSKAATCNLWSRTSRRIRMGMFVLGFGLFLLGFSVPAMQTADISLPSLKLEYGVRPKFNESKVALLIENRANPILAPLMLHFMSVVPPDWRFRFMGSIESVEAVNASVAIQEQVAAGKLDLTYIPANMSTASQEEISRFLTTLWLYEHVLQPAEWLLIYQTDSVLCANSPRSLNEFLEYDWVGAPWNPKGRFGGNGGLSLRRVSAIIDILRSQVRVDGSEPEDVWLTDRLGHRPGSKLANGTTALLFSAEMHSGQPTKLHAPPGNGEFDERKPKRPKYNNTQDAVEAGELIPGLDDWRDGFYEPMGYHTGGSGTMLHGSVWGTPALRKHIWDYCPEVKMTLVMDVASFVPGNCGANWKRSEGGAVAGDSWVTLNDLGYGTEVIDGDEYPLLPPGLRPW